MRVTTKPLLSFSQISTYLRCRQGWRYIYQENLAPRVDARPLSLGSAVHMGLATALREYYYGWMSVKDCVRKGVKSWEGSWLGRFSLRGVGHRRGGRGSRHRPFVSCPS